MKEINTKAMMIAYLKYETARKTDKYIETEKCRECFEQFLNESEKLTRAIEDAEGRSTARTIDAKMVLNSLNEIEKKLNIPKRYLEGCTVYVDLNAQEFPKAYKYTPESTHYSSTYKNGSWRITEIWRGKTGNVRVKAEMTADAEQKILERYRRFYV